MNDRISPTMADAIKKGRMPLTDDAAANMRERAVMWRRMGNSPSNAARLAREGFIADDGYTLDEMQDLLKRRNEAYYHQKHHQRWVE